MPLFDFACRDCNRTTELLVRGSDTPRCPACGSDALEKQVSLAALSSETTRGLAMRAARRRDAAQGKDRTHEQLKYEQSHDRHGH